MNEAWRLAQEDPLAAPRIQKMLKAVEEDLTRNEQAALAFVIIQKLKNSSFD